MITIVSLFKYLRREYAESLALDGEVRIGTLHEFRARELGPAIGDPDEGTIETTHAFDQPVDVTRSENQSWVTKLMFNVPPGASNIVFSGLSLVVPEAAPDSYVYCTSHQFNQRTMEAFGADACVEIFDPEGFANTLLAAVREQGRVTTAEMAPCDYSGRGRSHAMKRANPAFVKNASYRYQHEIRIVLRPAQEGPLEPFITRIPELTQYCRLRHVA